MPSESPTSDPSAESHATEPTTPSESAPTPDASSGAPSDRDATARDESSGGESDESSGGESDESSGGESDESSGGESDESSGGESDESSAAKADGDKPKRKRKRRRKKKPAEGGEAASAAPVEGSGQAAPTKSQKQKKPQKHRPPSDRAPFHAGEEVFGKVTSVIDAAIMIDLSGKALAIFDRSEMEPDDLVPAVGDRFVARVHQDGSRGGLVVLTRKPLREEEAKPKIEQAAKDGTHVQALVTGVIRGGVEVDIQGLRGFAPASGMDLHPHNANFTDLLGTVLDFKVVEYGAGGRDVVVTRRPMLEAEAHERRKKALSLLTEGQVMKGLVRTVVDWGAFIALPAAENLEGLVHATEASHDAHPRMAELFRPGEEIEVKITKIDERGKIWLSRRALISDPWQDARDKHPQGSRFTGKVVRVEKFGVFVEVEEGIDGLIHVADLTLKKIDHPEQIVKAGETMDVIVSQFDLRNRKISLHPAPPPERANEAPQRVTKSGVVKVEVVRGEAAGVVVRLLGVTGRGARGFIPAGQTGTARGTDLRKKFPPGQILDVKVLELDPRRGEPKLSITRAAEDEERRAHKEYRQQLAKEGGFGTLGDLLKKSMK